MNILFFLNGKKIIVVEGLSYSEYMREQQILWFTHVCTEQLNPSSPFISTQSTNYQ